MTSGDVETHPGPQKLHLFKIMGILLLAGLVILITGIILYNAKATVDSPKTSSKIPTRYDHLDSACNLLIIGNRKKHIKIRTRAAYLLILLLTSGDIQPNPGPNSEHCLICKKVENNTQLLTCETCKGWCHISCSDDRNHQTRLTKNCYQWHCPNLKCPPNHHPGNATKIQQATNQYQVLLKKNIEKDEHERFTKEENARKKLFSHLPKISEKPTKEERDIKKLFSFLPRISSKDFMVRIKAKPPKHPRVASIKKKSEGNLFKVLPKISHRDYVGKELCNSCLTIITGNNRAIPCKSCDRWTHAKCCDINKNEYNRLKYLKRPEWNCKKCRTSEDRIYTHFSRALCSEKQLPDEWDEIIRKKQKEEEIILHFNCRSIIDKADELTNIANNLKPAAIFLTETWLDDSCPKGTAVPENYTIIRKDRSSAFKQKYGKSNGGGVAILVRKGVKISMETNLNNDGNEILWCKLKMKKSKHLIGLIYRASYTDLLKPDVDGITEMEELIQRTLDANLMIIGDLNCDTRNAESTQDTKTLMNITEDYKLKQMIEKPTRFCESTATTIDHIWVREETLITKAGTCDGLSDHCGIYAYLKEVDKEEPEEVRTRNFKSFNEDEFRKEIKMLLDVSNFRHAIEQKEVNNAFNILVEALQTAANIHAPWKRFKPKQDQRKIPWFSSELSDVTNTKNMYLKLYRMYNKAEDKELYRKAKNKQTHLKRQNKREYYTRKINEYVGESRKMWSILKEVTNYNYKEDIMPDNADKDTANRFNSFFATVGIKVQEMLNININPPKLNKEGAFRFKKETTERIEYLINRIKPNVATGHDELSARLIKAASPVILEDLTDLVNLSYETRIFPENLKKATVRALHKKGGNNDPAQYRPVSILTILSKIFERSAVEQLIDYYNQIGILNKRQHAYKKYHSTTTCLFEIIETARKHIDDGNLVAIASLDLSKAFDSLAHNLILRKLNEMGLNESATTWIHSYLSNRKQTVKLGNVESEENIVESGVPQGSILGPLLFITCTNDIVEKMEEYDICMYADDMQIVMKGENVKELGEKLEVAIQKANKYYNENSLLCNPTKTEVMLVGTKIRLAKSEQLIVKTTNGSETKYITGEKSLKILGVHVDESLDWKKHTSSVKQKATNCIRNLHRVNQLIPMKQRRILYNSLVTPHFSYADTIWGNCGAVNSNKLQQAQNFAAKSMLGISKYSSSTQALKKLELLPLCDKRKINTAVLTKKSLSGRAPDNLQQLYQKQIIHSDTRAATRGDLRYPKHRLQQYKQGPLYTSIKNWNTIPENLRNLNLTRFKKDLQKHLTIQYIEM